MSKTALVIMTALIPTTGHASLIEFASGLRGVTSVEVMLNSRSFEPYGGRLRAHDFMEHFKRSIPPVTIRDFEDDTVPQNEEDHPHFWQWWAGYIRTSYPDVDFNSVVLVASEQYGRKVAEALGCDFMPYDIDREILPISGTDVRNDMFDNWEYILPGAQRFWQTRVTLFGQESVGKSTLTQLIGQYADWTALPEYARGYLESVGSELNQEKMTAIFDGQEALQWMNHSTPLIVQDTDLYSTIGYSTLNGYEVTALMKLRASFGASDIYFILPDSDVPFVEDELRYGGDKRESSMAFWANTLREYGENFIIVPEGDVESKRDFIMNTSWEYAEKVFAPLQNFVRE